MSWLTITLFLLYNTTYCTTSSCKYHNKTNCKIAWQHTINKLKWRHLALALNYKYLLRNDFLASSLKYISCQNNVKLHINKLIVFLPESRTKEMGWILILEFCHAFTVIYQPLPLMGIIFHKSYIIFELPVCIQTFL